MGVAAYTIGTFAVAVVWHVVIFKEQYQAFGYFADEPNFFLGFLTILIQGCLLCILFPKISFVGNIRARTLKFVITAGLFLWTSHVLAFLAKQTTNAPWSYLIMETFYLSLQFGLFGIFLNIIYAKSRNLK
ncbi:MAG: hypothetical protein ABJN26_22725 [Stappiaceae bacterium]